jgi:homoserine O-acetyltransferase
VESEPQTGQRLISEKKYFQFAGPDDPFRLVSGKTLPSVTLAYETWGEERNKDRTILVLHALSGDSHAAGVYSAADAKPGWWDSMIGPGRTFDTDRHFVICSNVIGGCMGSTGPSSTNPETDRPYGIDFPLITIKDMVAAQARLLDHLGIDKLFCAVGGSMGGIQALRWAVDFPDRVRAVIPIATTARHSAQAIAFYEVGRQAIMSDPKWNNGDYYDGERPDSGLALARMIAHITYLSEEAMHRKFARRLQNTQSRSQFQHNSEKEFAVESYLSHQGRQFVERFDANSYLFITKAMDYFDLTEDHSSLTEAFENVNAEFLVVSFSSDWHYPPKESKEIVKALRQNDIDVTYSEIFSGAGHDAFLIEENKLGFLIRGFLDNILQEEESA